MSNISLKEQLEAVASQLSDTLSKGKEQKVEKKYSHIDKSKKNKPKWLDHVHYGIELLKAYFPECFKSINEMKPLKKGIKQDLVKRLSTMEIVTEDKSCMVKSLSYYVNTIAYHKCIVTGADRINLEGSPEGAVTEEEAKYSIERRHARRQKSEDRRQTKQEA